MGIGIVALAVVTAVAIALVLKARRSKRSLQEKLADLAPDLAVLHDRVASLAAFESGYLMKKDWDSLLVSAIPVLTAIDKIPKRAIEESPQSGQIAFVTQRCQNPSYRDERNQAFKAHELELYEALLSDIDGGKSLDQQQRDAVVTDEYSNLVIAGAGSGKTSVVVGGAPTSPTST